MADRTPMEALADDIHARRIGLDNEDAKAAGVELKSYARAKKWRDQDRCRVNGMVIALSYWLGCPMDMAAAEAFIAQRAESERVRREARKAGRGGAQAR